MTAAPSFRRWPAPATLLLAASAALWIAALLIAVTGGVQFAFGPLHVSATDAPRVAFEAAVVLIIGLVARKAIPGAAFTAAVVCLLLAAAADSSIRRVGDGFEYLAMASNLARGDLPAVTLEQTATLRRDAEAFGDKTWVAALLPGLRGADGRYDFPHFWMSSLLAAPLVGLATAAGLHPAIGYTALNLLLLTLACVLLSRAGAPLVACLFALLMLWWVDKAHAEVFLATTTLTALLLFERSPGAALLLLGMATAQMPLLAPLLGTSALLALVIRRDRRTLAAALGAAAVAALHPLYYLWRLGTMSPLGDVVAPHLPGVRSLITPLLDPNLGVVWFAPLLAALVLIGVVPAIRARRATLVPTAVAVVTVLYGASQTPNVNHGGTPGMSRYGVWLLAMLTPLAVRGAAVAAGRWPRLLRGSAMLSVLFAAYALHPRLSDAGTYPAPTRLASTVWDVWPGLDDPLPEIFVERLRHIDGPVEPPAGTPTCRKVLVVGTGRGAAWPPHCSPRPVPAPCLSTGALCYANGGTFRLAPRP